MRALENRIEALESRSGLRRLHIVLGVRFVPNRDDPPQKPLTGWTFRGINVRRKARESEQSVLVRAQNAARECIAATGGVVVMFEQRGMAT